MKKQYAWSAALWAVALLTAPAALGQIQAVEIDKLLASDAAEFDQFGSSVSLSGDYAIVGASGVVDGPDSGRPTSSGVRAGRGSSRPSSRPPTRRHATFSAGR